MTTPVLTEDALKGLEELLGKATPGKWRRTGSMARLPFTDPKSISDLADLSICGDGRAVVDVSCFKNLQTYEEFPETFGGEKESRKIVQDLWAEMDANMNVICALRNNAAELLRGYRLGISLDKDRKP